MINHLDLLSSSSVEDREKSDDYVGMKCKTKGKNNLVKIEQILKWSGL